MMAAQKLDQIDAMQAMAAIPQQDDIELRWHVLLTEPNREIKARDHLRDVLKFEGAYVPTEQKTEYRTVRTMFGNHRRAYETVRPIFRGYLFLPLNIAWSFGPLYSVPGLRQNGHPFLQLNGHVATLDDDDIGRIRRAEDRLANPPVPGLPYKVGDVVKVMEGPFTDFEGKIERLDDEGRISLLMDLLGRKTKFLATARQIAAKD